MSKKHKQKDTPALIADYLISKEISDELAQWIAESDENGKFIDSFGEADSLVATLVRNQQQDEHDTLQAWNRVANTLRDDTKTLKRKRKPLSSRAAVLITAAAFLVALVTGTFLLLDRADDSTAMFAVLSEIEVPYDRTVLVTSDGTIIELDDTTDHHIDLGNGLSAEYSEGKLIYPKSMAKGAGDNRISVPRGAMLDVVLSDGTCIKLNSLSELIFPVAFEGDERKVKLEGEAYMDVAHHADRPFTVTTATDSYVRVLGTRFNISAYPHHDILATTLIEGSVEMVCDRFTYRLLPNEHLSYDRSSECVSTSYVDPDQYTAWSRGELVFTDISLEETMKQLALYYDIEAYFESDLARKTRFGFKLPRYETIDPILEFMQLTSKVTFRKEGHAIYIDYDTTLP